MKKLLVWFKELKKSDVGLAGGKGANLGELLMANMPVPDGFVITAQTYKKFLEDSQIRDDINDILKEVEQVGKEVALQIRNLWVE